MENELNLLNEEDKELIRSLIRRLSVKEPNEREPRTFKIETKPAKNSKIAADPKIGLYAYVDGCALINNVNNVIGKGGAAAVIFPGKHIFTEHIEKATNNRAEIIAACLALENTTGDIDIFSDSQYVVNTMTKNWRKKMNSDLWARLEDAKKNRKVRWFWVKGHAGDEYNELADRMARKAALQ